jgi:hypothetical protein
MAPGALRELLADLAAQDFREALFVATSLGTLRLTTARSHEEMHQHDAVAVGVRGSEFVVSYVEAGAAKASPSTICGAEELREVVERYLLRLTLHKD